MKRQEERRRRETGKRFSSIWRRTRHVSIYFHHLMNICTDNLKTLPVPGTLIFSSSALSLSTSRAISPRLLERHLRLGLKDENNAKVKVQIILAGELWTSCGQRSPVQTVF